jgi:hypothetical protein
MPKRSSLVLKQQILKCIKERDYSYAELERRINTGFRTIKDNCHELQFFEAVKINSMKEHPSNGRPSYSVSITNYGRRLLEKA